MTRTTTTSGGPSALIAVALGMAIFAIYNANGREIDVGDSVPSRLAAREFVLRNTFALDYAVKERPEYEGWSAFVKGRDGHYRSAYSFAPAVEAAMIGALLNGTGAIDMGAPRAASLVAKLAASLLTALACAFAFLTARRRTTTWQAILIAVGLGLGTGLWPTVSQTLWQHETAIFGLMAAVWLLERQPDQPPPLWALGLALGLAGMARAQITPAIAVLAVAAVWRTRSWRSVVGLWPLAACALGTAALGVLWFGHPLGPRLAMLSDMPQTHMVPGTISREPWVGALGLLVSPNRGILIFSPVVLVAFAGVFRIGRAGTGRSALRWYGAAALAQYLTYSAFSVWWAGYTYGPRYMLDLLPMLVPLAAVGLSWLAARRAWRWVLTALLAWSIAVSAIGAFCYSAGVWNPGIEDPDDVDLKHERLWDWHDLEIVTAVKSGWHGDNFQLFDRTALRRPAAK